MIQHQPITRVIIQQDGEHTVLAATTKRGRAVANYTTCERTEDFSLAVELAKASREGIETSDLRAESLAGREARMIGWIWFHVMWGLAIMTAPDLKQVGMMSVMLVCFALFSWRVPLDWWRRISKG